MVDIEADDSFRKRLRRKSRQLQDAIARCCQQLADNPRHPGLQTHRIQGTRNVWEAYIDKGNRITFHYAEDGHIVLRNHCNHDILRRNP
jgi:plasmid stabilization system protein ParE